MLKINEAPNQAIKAQGKDIYSTWAENIDPYGKLRMCCTGMHQDKPYNRIGSNLILLNRNRIES